LPCLVLFAPITDRGTDSSVSKCNAQKAVTRSAYLLFYRRRTPHPLGPPTLQKIVQAAESDPSADSDEDERSRPRNNQAESGNGQRLDASSRNGSSSASTAGTGVAAGVAVLRGGGSHQHSGHGSPLKNGAEVANLSENDDEGSLPPFENDGNEDEGYGEEAYDSNERYGGYGEEGPIWSFEGIGSSSLHAHDASSDDVASDAPNAGSEGGGMLEARLREDFGEDMVGHAGSSTPVEGIQPVLGGEMGDGDVHEIRVLGE
jgi:ubiquitin carboxyl-terminal hydrolase 4/11/15